MGAASLDYIFTTPPTQVAGATDALMKSLLAFNFDTRRAENLRQV